MWICISEKRRFITQHVKVFITSDIVAMGLEKDLERCIAECCYCSAAKSYPTLCDPVDWSTPGFPVLHYLPELAHTQVHWVSDATNHLIFCYPLLPSFFPSIRVFSNESALPIRWPKYWSFSFNISPSNEYSRLISYRIDWFDFFAVQGTLKSLLQYHNSEASILQCSAFFMVQLSHPYMTNGKIIALTIWTFVGKVMSLLLNMLSRFVIAFLSRSKYILILWLQSSSSDFGVQENKICHCFHFFSIYLLSSDRTRYYDLSFLNVEF